MKKLFICISLCIFTYSILKAQLSDDFSDGNMSEDPVWGGDISKFEVDASLKLHLNAPTEASQAYLSTTSAAVGESEWSWYTEINVNPSSTNFCKVYLVSDQAALDGPLNGYFVKIGGTTDEVSLYRQQGLTETMLINGSDGRVNVSLVQIWIKVKRDISGNWTMEVRPASEPAYVEEGTAFDDSYTSSAYFGVYCKYTATRSTAFSFDNFLVTGGPIPDQTPPSLLTYSLSSSRQIDLSFSEPLSATHALQKANYLLNGQEPENISHNQHLVSLTFPADFPNAVTQTLKISGVADESHNLIIDTLIDVFYFEKVKAIKGSLVINEIFPDPSPTLLSLPDESDAEFIELYNPDVHPYDLNNWMINDKVLPSFILMPGQYLILCKPAYETIFKTYGQTVSLSSWPTLSNSGGNLVLTDDETHVIDVINYVSSEVAGGISLERIYIQPPCNGQANLALSQDQNGATPGMRNTVFSDEADLSSPELLQITTLREDSLVLKFSEKVYLPQPYTLQISIDDQIFPKEVTYSGPDSSQFSVVFDLPLTSHANYRLNIQGAYDCSGNVSSSIQHVFYMDLKAPFVQQIIVLDTAEVVIKFSEKLLKTSAEKESNYMLYPFAKNPKKAALASDSLSVTLTFPVSLDIQDSIYLSIQQVEDQYKNKISDNPPLAASFLYSSQIDSLYIINEHQIDILFKIVPDAHSALDVSHYEIDRLVGNPARVIINEHNPSLVHLLLQNALSLNKLHILTVSNLLDEEKQLISTPRYYFFYDTKGPAITRITAIDAKEIILFFDEIIHMAPGQKLNLWVDKDSVSIESYTLHKDAIHLKLQKALIQERNYKLGIEGITDVYTNLSNPNQNFAFLLDQVAPKLDTAFLYSPHELILVFHEPVLEEDVNAEHYLQLLQSSNLPTQVRFYQLAPERVLFSFDESLNAGILQLQIQNFSDRQQNKMLSPLTYRIENQSPCIAYIFPQSNRHLRLQFTSDIQNLVLSRENFAIDRNHRPDSLALDSEHQVDLWFTTPLSDFTEYQLEFSYENRKQSINFVYQDFVESVAHDGNSTVRIQFSVPLEAHTAEQLENYILASQGNPLGAVYLPEAQSVQLLFSGEIDRKILHTMNIQGLLDIDYFPLPQSSHFFGMGRSPAHQEILITEIMAKPAPSLLLPEYEYVEIYNASTDPLQLKGMKLADAQKSVSLNEMWLSPGEYLILCSTSAVARLSAYGSCMGISGFPSLNDKSDTLTLFNADGHEIYTVAYSEEWYNDAGKKSGGWSLEMIDTGWPCQEKHNWRASVHPSGGTPGKANSVQQSNPDLQAPVLLQAVAEDSLHLILTFSEKLEKETIQEAEITLDSLSIHQIIVQKEDQLKVELNTPLQAGVSYTLTVSHLADCSGNVQLEKKTMDILLPERHQRNDILVSEILFHTRSGGVDFVELYNNSDKYLNLRQWKLATLKQEVISNSSLISNETLILAPHQYVAITKNKHTLLADYPQASKGSIFESKAFPSLLADGGTLLLIDDKNEIMQRIDFSPDWHHPLLREKRGVSLERISWNTEENNQQYWQSAASNVGYATPGYQNSQWQNLPGVLQALQIDPPIFYPDQSGYRDYTRIYFQLEGTGNIGNLKIFDARGKMVRQLAQNQSLSEEGFFTWDGTDDSKKRANIGYYIVWMEVFRPDGSVNILKSKVAVASRY